MIGRARRGARDAYRKACLLTIVVTGAIGTTVLATPAVATAAANGSDRGGAADPLRWRRCGGGFECATLAVPVDASDPTGEQVPLALIRAPARVPSRRVGVLVVNYGGPGDPGTVTLRHALRQIPPEIRDRFDIVSFDPRGTGASRPVDCIDDRAADALVAEDPTPDDPEELERFFRGDDRPVDVDGACIARYGAWLAAIGTRNVARDLDRIRDALGERRVNFLGFSYGTVLGALYAQEFPTRVRTMVLDGAVDLSASPLEVQASQAAGFENALDTFLRWCASTSRCAYHSGGDPRRALAELRDRFEAGLRVPVGDGRLAGVSAFYFALVASLYDREHGWPVLGVALRNAADGDGTLLQALADVFLGRGPDGRYDNRHEVVGLIRCADAPHPVPPFAEFQRAFVEITARAPFLGALVAGSPPGCDPRLPRPSAADVIGDLHADGVAPVLVIGTTGDPATPYAGAFDLAARIAGARVLTFESTEHGAYGRGVPCIDEAVGRYLLRRTLPPPGTRCSA